MNKITLLLCILVPLSIILTGCGSEPLAGKAVSTPVTHCEKIENGKVLAVDFTGSGNYDTYPDKCNGNVLMKNTCTMSTGSFSISRESVTCEFGCENAECIQPTFGCTDHQAENFNADATQDDGSCTFPPPEPICSTENPELCQTQQDCVSKGLFWWSDGTCLNRPEPQEQVVVPPPAEEQPAAEEVPVEEEEPAAEVPDDDDLLPFERICDDEIDDDGDGLIDCDDLEDCSEDASCEEEEPQE